MPATIKIDRAEFARLNDEGWSIARLAAHFEANPATISRLRRHLGINRDARRMMDNERRARIQTMLSDGWPFKEINRTEGADMETLRKHFPGQQWTPEQARRFQSETRHTRRQVAA